MDVIKAFQNNDLNIQIHILGTYEEPLFRASDVGEVLEISTIRSVIRDFDDTEKVVHSMHTLGGQQNVNFLTEKGLYQVLFTSRKPIAKTFKNWVCQVIKEIRLNGKYELEKQIKDITKQKEQNLLKNFSKKTMVYIGYAEENILKFGWTDDGETRIEDHKKTYRPDFTFEYVYESHYAREIERKIKTHPLISSNIISKIYNNKKRIELIKLDKNFTIKNIDKIITEIKDQIEKEESDKDKNMIIDRLKLELFQNKEKYEAEIQDLKNEIQDLKEKKVSSPPALLPESLPHATTATASLILPRRSDAVARSERARERTEALFEQIRPLFTLTTDEQDILTCKEAHQIIIDNGIEIDIAKITVFMDKIGVTKSFDSRKCRIFKCVKYV